MQNIYSQMLLAGIYGDTTSTYEKDKPTFPQMLDDYSDFDSLIPCEFHMAFYNNYGRPHEYCLDGFNTLFYAPKNIRRAYRFSNTAYFRIKLQIK